MENNYQKLATDLNNLKQDLHKLLGDTNKYSQFEQRVNKVIKSQEDLERIKNSQLILLNTIQSQAQQIEMLKAICGLSLDRDSSFTSIKEIDIPEEEFHSNYKELLATRKGNYYFNTSTSQVELVAPILEGWEITKNENNTIFWKNEDRTLEIPFIPDPNLSREDNFEMLKKVVKHKLRHPLEIVTVNS